MTIVNMSFDELVKGINSGKREAWETLQNMYDLCTEFDNEYRSSSETGADLFEQYADPEDLEKLKNAARSGDEKAFSDLFGKMMESGLYYSIHNKLDEYPSDIGQRASEGDVEKEIRDRFARDEPCLEEQGR